MLSGHTHHAATATKATTQILSSRNSYFCFLFMKCKYDYLKAQLCFMFKVSQALPVFSVFLNAPIMFVDVFLVVEMNTNMI